MITKVEVLFWIGIIGAIGIVLWSSPLYDEPMLPNVKKPSCVLSCLGAPDLVYEWEDNGPTITDLFTGENYSVMKCYAINREQCE